MATGQCGCMWWGGAVCCQVQRRDHEPLGLFQSWGKYGVRSPSLFGLQAVLRIRIREPVPF
jgi:hypothetical protein